MSATYLNNFLVINELENTLEKEIIPIVNVNLIASRNLYEMITFASSIHKILFICIDPTSMAFRVAKILWKNPAIVGAGSYGCFLCNDIAIEEKRTQMIIRDDLPINSSIGSGESKQEVDTLT